MIGIALHIVIPVSGFKEMMIKLLRDLQNWTEIYTHSVSVQDIGKDDLQCNQLKYVGYLLK